MTYGYNSDTMASAESQKGCIPFSEVAQEVVAIAVMGKTGSGKSNFIHKLTGSKAVVVGDGLQSCTERPMLHKFSLDGKDVVLIDTPGFDDTFRTDADVLQQVADCLAFTYQNNLKLSGIIYVHRITDNRMDHGSMANLAMFRKLCGPDPMKNVLLATTFWDKETAALAEMRLDDLSTNPNYWGDMVDAGAQVVKFHNSRDSAQGLVRDLIYRGRVDLQIQKEMVLGGLPLAKTEAGQALNKELAELAARHAEEISRLRRDMEEAQRANDTKMHDALKREATKREKKLNELRQQQERLKEDRRSEMRALEHDFTMRLRRLELEKQTEADERVKREVEKWKKMQSQSGRTTSKPNASNGNNNKKQTAKRWVPIAGAAITTAVSVAAVLINPGAAGSAIQSFVHLANTIFGNESEDVNGDPNAGDEVDGGAEEVDVGA